MNRMNKIDYLFNGGIVMKLRKILCVLIITFILVSSVQSSISYSTEKNTEVINQSQLINKTEDVNEEIDNDSKEQVKINLDDIIKDPNDDTENIVEDDLENMDEPIDEIIEITEFNINGLQLREGISSDEVLRAKRFLKIKGYTDLVEGYYFDENLKTVVVEYQKKNVLNPDGIIGPKTFNVINEDMKTNLFSIPEISIQLPEIVPSDKWILINKESNTLYHYDKSELINKYPIASGKVPTYTPEGKFTIIKKFVNPSWGGAGRYTPIRGGASNNPLGKRWLGLSIGGGGTYGIHGNADVYSIGKHVSLGCIRMFNEDIEQLFDIIDIHTDVWIFGNISEVIEIVEEVEVEDVELDDEQLEDVEEIKAVEQID